MERIDAAVVGAGVVGLAVAARLARSGRLVAILESEPRHGLGSSSRNSEVVHAGFYYPGGSLKARLCVPGRRRLYELASAGAFFCRKTGKLVVATRAGETAKLEALERQGRENGVEGLRLVSGRELAALAPGVRGEAALWSPETGIMDTEEVMAHFLGAAQDAGAMLLWSSPLSSAERVSGGYELRARGQEPILAACVVNAAGLAADKVAALPGLDCEAAGYRLHFYKGEYFSLRRGLPIETLVYPLPGPAGLGIHLTLDRLGRQRLGPSSFPVSGLDYAVDPSHRSDFFRAASAFLPGLALEDLLPGTSGIRPKLAADGSFRDFIIQEESARGLPGWVNLVGIESPGFTASPAIADLVADVLEWPT